MSRRDNPLVIYHGGCDDGFGAAWAAHTVLGGSADYWPGVYQQDPPDVTGRQVFLLDFSYKRPLLEAMAAKARGIVVLDHHDTARAELAPLLETGVIQGEFDMARSGAMMAWDWWHPGEEPPELLEYIQDRDLWRHRYAGTNAVIMALRSYPQSFDVWTSLTIDRLRDEGEAILRYVQQTVVKQGLEHAHRLTFSRLNDAETVHEDVRASNVPYYAASEVAGKLAEDAPFAAAYFRTSERDWLFSLRSRGAVHVGEIAKVYGGGGHPQAAGFRIESLADL